MRQRFGGPATKLSKKERARTAALISSLQEAVSDLSDRLFVP